MPVKQQKMLKMFEEARDTTIPSKQSFEQAFNAIPAYREYMLKEVLARSTLTIDDQIFHFLKNRMRDLRSVTYFTVDQMRSTGKYIIKFCSKAFDVLQ